jgi:hypothetical protein
MYLQQQHVRMSFEDLLQRPADDCSILLRRQAQIPDDKPPAGLHKQYKD